LTYANGDKYVGGWRDDKQNGQGTYTYGPGEWSGDKFVGEFKDGKRNGQGTYASANGDKFVGEYKDDAANGQGTKTTADGSIKQSGIWKDGKFVGVADPWAAAGFSDTPPAATPKAVQADPWAAAGFSDQPVKQQEQPETFAEKYIPGWKKAKANVAGKTWGEVLADTTPGRMARAVAQERNWTRFPSATSVPMTREGGVYVVPVVINNVINLNFVVDSGAADVSIPSDVVMTLVRTGTLKASDFLEEQTYVLADGTKVPSQTFLIRSLKVGGKIVEDVSGSVASVNGSLLLGQSFLSRFKSWSVDNAAHALVLDE
jgi:predicted aspartyl protease